MNFSLRSAPWVVLALLAAGCPPPAPPPPPQPGPLEAGVATVPLDVPVGVAMGGYGRHPGAGEPGSVFAKDLPSSRGVHSLPTARALAMSDGLTRVVFVRLDVCLTTSSLRFHAENLLRARGHDATLVVGATHTHAGPARFFRPILGDGTSGTDAAAMAMDVFDPEQEERLATSIADAAQGALEAMKPASVGMAGVDAPDFNHDRRCENDDLYGSDFRDKRLTVVRFDEVDADGTPVRPLAGFLHYAMHGTTLGGDNHLMSTDSPGAMELYASDAVGVPMVYLQGTAGDVSPSSGPLGHQGFQAIERVGRLAAPLVADAFARAAPPSRPAAAKLQLFELPVDLSRAALGYERGEFLENGGVGCMLGGSNCPPVPTAPKDIICLPLKRRSFNQTSVVALRVEGVLLTTLPGEPATAIGQRVRETVGSLDGVSEPLVIGYAQDHFGYLLEGEDWLRGGYEPTVSPWGWKFGPFMVGKVGEAVAALGQPLPAKLQPEAIDVARRAATASSVAPGTLGAVADLARLGTAVLSFHGGDPALGTPRVALEREEGGSFIPVMASPTRPLVGGPEIVLRYAATPTFAADPAATARDHLWTAEWETLPNTPVGRYRLVVSGKALSAAVVSAYSLTSAPFAVAVARSCGTGASAALGADGKLVVKLRFPPNPSVFVSGTQVANYRLRDALSPPGDGALALGGTGIATVTFPDATTQSVSLSYDAALRGHVAQVKQLAGKHLIHIDPGGFVDGSGNVNTAALDLEATP
ncbi:MAG: neutral/alkaline non-lysosomal ceramidase N-terminal domain-containing protein [Myxococcaceae bacterium]